MSTKISRNSFLLQNLVLFGRLLRDLGLDINPEQQMTLLRALEYINIANRLEFYHAARCLAVNDKDELPLFDAAFNLFWRKPSTNSLFNSIDNSKQTLPIRLKSPNWDTQGRRQSPYKAKKIDNEKKPTEGDEFPLLDLSQTYSSQEILRNKDFSELDDNELASVKELISQLSWQLGFKRSRRFKAGRGSSVDIRRSLRSNLQFGGEILQWSYRQHKIKPRPLVVIADISGSMEQYTSMLLHFTYSLAVGLKQPFECFVFSTRLTRITNMLRSKDIEKVMRAVSRKVPDWSGGTRIGEALKRFNYDWARRILGHGEVVLLISDGWDRGSPRLLSHEIARLQRSCHRLIWLNPLLGSPEYEPKTRGMQAALPYIDDFLPVHNLESLEQLARKLYELDRKHRLRKVRSQSILAA